MVLLIIFLSIGDYRANADSNDVIVGVYDNSPKVFIDDTGKPAGIFIDILEYIAAEEGWQLKYVPGTWAEGLDRLKRGEIDIMPDVDYTAERDAIFDFHENPVLASWFQIYARKGSGIRSILDLAGKRIAVLERSVQQDAFIQLAKGFDLKITLVSLPDYQSCFEQVHKGIVDAAITNSFYGLIHAKEYGLDDTAIIFSPNNLFFAAPRNSRKQLLDAIDKHLIELKENPKSIYYQSLRRWTAEKVEFNLPVWVKIIGIIIGTALLMSLMGSAVLKRQVNAHTFELRQINKEMESRIEIRTAELAAAMDKAQAADHLKSAFLATMSHELRTPLNSIIGFTGILLQGLAGPLNDEQQKQLQMVQNSSRHLLALINDVLDISKIEAGELSLSFTSFELRSSIQKMMSIVAPLAEQKSIALISEISNDVSTITTDQRRLEQIILNLLNNAVKFTEQGHVKISCRVDNDHYILSVSDTGISIQPKDIPGLFQPFHQVDTSLARKHEGTGLGLSICKKLIVMMGGNIDVQSQFGQGSTFSIRLPKRSGVSL